KFFIGAGPYLSFFYNGKERTETFMKTGDLVIDENTDLPVGDAPGKYKTLDFGLNGTAGIEFGKFFLAANFSRGITDFYTASYDGSFKHQVIGGTLGIFLGKPVSLEPKVKDRDNDGIMDTDDLCPDEPGSPATNGCPDTDADGIADKQDKCPQQKGVVKYNGCPVPDTDGDGVNDDEDKCKDVPGLQRYEGCPVPDTDKDGINDEEDKCKDVPGYARYQGCPVPDTDGDGINDEEDKCPNAAGKKENNGCPEVSKEIIAKVEYAAKRIQFKYAKAELLPESKLVLDEVADILIKNQNLKLEIEGHTSNDGSLDANMKLSTERAEAVKTYIAEKGVEPSRLSAIGYGPNRPLNTGKSEAEKALNRRVELKPVNN
ncbi:MAG: OmpA family protein, partial [Chitinophagaceae bacterium]